MKKIKIMNVQFDVCTRNEALGRIFDALENRGEEGAKQIVTPNPEMLLAAGENKKFMEVLNRAWLSIPDGIGILWASTFQNSVKRHRGFLRYIKAFFSLLDVLFYPKSLRKIFPQRITGVDIMESICELSVQKKYPIFLLGAQPGVAGHVKKILETKYPEIKIVGIFSGSPSHDDFISIQPIISEMQPKILFVAFGSPAQELWIAEHVKNFPSVKIAMGVGGAFDFLAGIRSRAPKWMQRLGLEWLYRLIQQPSRIKRIWNAVVKFPLRIIAS